MAEVINLIGQADPEQRATRAFRAVIEWRRDAATNGDKAQPVNCGKCLRTQCVVETHADALAALAEIEGTLAAAIAIVFEHEPLDTELDELGLIGASRHMRPPTALVIDRLDRAVLPLDQIELGDQAKPLGG